MSTIKVPTRDLGKEVIRSDFVEGEYDKEMRAYGYRCYWQAGNECPCRIGTQNENPDPSCKACSGDGFVYVHPDPGEPTIKEYLEMSPPFCDTDTARATQALMTSMTRDTEMFDKLGVWVLGTARLTTFSFNAVAFRDRFTMVDSTMAYKQVVTLGDSKLIKVGRRPNQIRYPVVKLAKVFAVNPKSGTVTDFTAKTVVAADGSLDLTATTAAAGQLISLRYMKHPVWIVMDHPAAVRDTLVKKKSGQLPIGKHVRLPIMAMVKLEFLLNTGVVG